MYEMSCYGFPTGPGGTADGRMLPTSQSPGLGWARGGPMYVRSGTYMGALGRSSSLSVSRMGARGVDMAALYGAGIRGLAGAGLGVVGGSAGAAASASVGADADSAGGGGWETALEFFRTAVQGAPDIIAAARDQSAQTITPAPSTGPGVAYYESELERLRAQQARQAPAAPTSLIPGVSNGALLGIGAVLVIGTVLTVSLSRRREAK